jgi:WD40 repeat protein
MDSEQPTEQSSQEQEEIDDTPTFVDMNEAVEVQVDNDMPMDEDDDNQGEDVAAATEEPAEDMSKVILESHTDHVYSVASHFDSASRTLYVISGGGDDKAFLHKIGVETATMPLSYAHKDSVSCAAFNMAYVSEDLTKTPLYAAVGAYDGAIVIYDPTTGAKLQELEGPSDVEFVSFHPKGGSVLLVGSAEDGTVWMYHLPTSKCLQVFVGHESGVTAGGFTPDGKWALSASADGTLRVWAPRTGVNKHVFRVGEDGAGLTCLATDGGADGKLAIVGAEDGFAHVCHVGTKKVVASLRHFEPPLQKEADTDVMEMELPMSVEAVGFASNAVNANWCATGGVDGVLKIWDLTNGQCRQVCSYGSSQSDSEKTGGITRLQWHPTLPLVYTAGSDGVVRVWDARNGSMIAALTGHSDMINDMDVDTVDGKAVIVSGSDDKSVRVFEVDIAAALQGS